MGEREWHAGSRSSVYGMFSRDGSISTSIISIPNTGECECDDEDWGGDSVMDRVGGEWV